MYVVLMIRMFESRIWFSVFVVKFIVIFFVVFKYFIDVVGFGINVVRESCKELLGCVFY